MRIGVLASLFFVISMSSCLKEPEAIIVADVSDIFSLGLNQELGENRLFQLELNILELQECEDIKINSNLLSLSSDLILEINSIEKPETCAGDMQRISKTHNINISPGDYQFNIVLADASVNNGIISVAQNEISLQFNELEGIQISDFSIQRIPDQTIWGTFFSENTLYDKNKIREVLFEAENINVNGGLQFGHYGHFNINEDQTVDLAKSVINGHHFYVSNESINWDNISDKMTEWRNENPDVEFIIYNELGEILSSN